MGQVHPRQVPLVQLLAFRQLTFQFRSDRTWQHHDPILVSLAAAHHDLITLELEIMDTQAATFANPQAAPVQQAGH